MEVDLLPRPESVQLIHRCLRDVDDADADRLAETGMPVERYLGLLETSSAELLNHNPPANHPVSLAVAIRVATDGLAEVDPAALALVRTGAFLSLGRVGSYGLARVADRSLQLHRLTQTVLRDQLTAEDAAAYRAHAQALLVAADPGNAANALGRDRYALGQVEAARQLHEDGLTRARRILGENHSWTMDCANHLAADLHALGEFEAARHLSADTLARARRVLGDQSHFTIDAANNLTAALHALDDPEAALPLSEDTLRQARQVFGDDHPRTRRAADNLATTLRLLGETGPK